MKVTLKLDRKMRIIGKNEREHETVFDAAEKGGGENTAASPMEIMLQAMGSCSFMDVISILRKKKVTIDNIEIEIKGERAEVHPKVFTKVHLNYMLTTPDGSIHDLERSIDLSQNKYCGAAAMFRQSGCEVTYEAHIITPE